MATEPTPPDNYTGEPLVRGNSTSFKVNGSIFASWIITVVPQLAALAINVWNNAVGAHDDALSASSSATAADVSEAAALASATAAGLSETAAATSQASVQAVATLFGDVATAVGQAEASATVASGAAASAGADAAQLGGLISFANVATPNFKVGKFLKDVTTRPCRVLLTGTSIASFDASSIQVLARQLQNVYGKNGTVITSFGVWGGTYGPSGGHKKQVYGGPGYFRMVMANGEADVSYSWNVDSFTLVYGQEPTGGSFDVWIDGVFSRTLSSNGVQAYGVEEVWTFATRAYRTITIKAPASGKAYLERLECGQNDSGIFIENDTLGGSGLWNTLGLMIDANAATNEAGIPIVGNNGVDAFFNRSGTTKPDIIICQHFTNDTNHVAEFSSALSRAVSTTKSAGTPLILLSEMPAVSFVNANGTLATAPQSILDAILQYSLDEYVSVLDWTQMVDFSDKAAYEARFFPTADKTHPTAEGHAFLLNPLCNLFSLPHPAQQSSYKTTDDGELYASLPNPVVTDDPYGLRFGRPGYIKRLDVDGLHSPQLSVIGEAIGYGGQRSAVHLSTDIPNLMFESDLALISGSGTADRYGPYRTMGAVATSLGAFYPFAATSNDQDFTLLILARQTGNASALIFNTPANNQKPRIYANSTLTPITDGILNNLWNFGLKDAPMFYFVNLRHHASSGMSGNLALSFTAKGLDVYGMWATEGKVPVIATRTRESYAGIGLPVYMTGDYAPNLVTVGQNYWELINGITVEKTALGGVVFKPLTNTFGRLYEMKNKGTAGFFKLLPNAPATLTYYPRVGGELYATATSNQMNGIPFASGVPYGKRYTLSVRPFSPFGNGMAIYFFNGGNNYSTVLAANGTWSSNNTFTRPTIAIPGSFGVSGNNLAYTFDLPDASFATALGASPTMYVVGSGGSLAGFGSVTLAEGNSACI